MTTNKQPTTEEVHDLIRYDPETGKLFAKKHYWRRKVGSELGTRHRNRLVLHVGGFYVEAHRLVAWIMLNRFPTTRVVCINGDKFDLRWCNIHALTANETLIANRWHVIPALMHTGRFDPDNPPEQPPQAYKQTQEEMLAPKRYAERLAKEVSGPPAYDNDEPSAENLW